MLVAAFLLLVPAIPAPPAPVPRAPTLPASGLRTTVSSANGEWTAMIFSAAEGDDSLWLESGESGEMKCLLGRACGGSDAHQWSIGTVAFSGDASLILITARTEPSGPLRRYSVDPGTGQTTLLSEAAAAHVQTP